MRPRLHPYVPLVWRDATTLQVGTPPAPSSLIEQADEALFSFIQSLDGRLPIDELSALPNCPKQPRLDQVLAALCSAHALIDSAQSNLVKPRLPKELRERTLWQTLTQDLIRSAPTSGSRAMRLRQSAYVFVHGANPLAFAVTHLLAVAGVGRLVLDASDHLPVKVRPESIIGLGPSWQHLGQPALLATRQIVADFGSEITRPKGLANPDCEIFTEWPSDEDRDRVNAERIDHLVTTSSGGQAVVGPFVMPGESACLRCVEMAEMRRDPAWAKTRVQLRSAKTTTQTLYDSSLTTWAASMSAMSVLGHVEQDQGEPLGLLLGQRLIAALPGPKISLETVDLECGCGCH